MSAALEWAALEAVHEYFRRQAFAIVAVEEHVPMLFGVLADASGHVQRASTMLGFEELMRDEAGKRRLAQLLPRLVLPDFPTHHEVARALGFEPNVWVQICEAWIARQIEGDPRPAGDRPDRAEVLMISLHTGAGTTVAVHPIEQTPTRHAVQTPFPKPGDVTCWSGRFTIQGEPPANDRRH